MQKGSGENLRVPEKDTCIEHYYRVRFVVIGSRSRAHLNISSITTDASDTFLG